MLKNLRPLKPYLWRYRVRYLVGFLILLGNNAVWIFFPLVIRQAIDSLHQNLARETVALYALLLVGIALAKALFLFWMRWILIGISRDIEYDLRNDLLVHLTKLAPRYYTQNRTGDLISRATNDLNAVRMLLGPGIMYSANTIVIFIAAIAVMLSIDWRLTLFALLPLPVVSFSVRYFGRMIHDRFEAIQAMFSTLSARVQENLAGVRVIRAYVQEEPETREFDRLNQEYIVKNLRLIRLWGFFYPSLEVFIGLGFVIVLWLGGRAVLRGEISIGSFVAFNAYMALLTWPMIALGWVVNLLERGGASMGRIQQIFAAQPEIADRELPVQPPAEVRGDIEFRNLTFTYNPDGNGRPVLRGINLRIRAGETVAIVGPTGSGKSTLANLIPRLYDAPRGSLFIDGQTIQNFSVARLRRAIGFVPQETFLFGVTVGENIAFGVEEANPEAIEGAAQVASIFGDIQDFPKKFDTLVGERGITLSGGQKQRTALARAILRNPKILILDDALSSVDTYTEEKILSRLSSFMRERTTILISHRVSTVRHADQIIVLKDGEIVERGRHDELLEHGGHYWELYQKQLLEEELERA